MRAVSQAAGPKILRIGVVQAGKVVDERLIKQRGTVTIGPSEKAMFVVPSRKIPPNFKLFELIGAEYYLNWLEGMSGRVALKTGISDLNALKAQAKPVTAGGITFYRVRLTDDSRGKVVVGETTFLFQFVVPPPVQPKPQLPVSVRKGVAGDVDWFTTIVAAFSFLFHFFLVALVYSDWMDPVVDDDYAVNSLIESVKSLPPPPPLEKPLADANSDATAASTAASDAPSKGPGDKGAGKGAQGKDGQAGADAKAAEIASQLAELDVQTVGALGGGLATEGVLGSSEVPAGLLDDAGRSSMGAGSGDPGGLRGLGGSGSGSVRPGAGGGGGLRDIGNTSGKEGGGATQAGKAKEVKGPVGSANVGGAGVAGGTVANANAVVARMKGRFRNCYQTGLNQNPEMQGSVTLTAKIGPNGEVLSVGGGGGGALGPIVPCLKAVVQSGGFSPPEGGGAVVTIPITFVKQ
ncbi:MAG TPA: AgmX/PglI C-terminal domain-containing protein [Polyangiaceae bacterium]|nr:AgmX/PglI C-terminal domain-containing protein [Polyangiaceae bacterium]